MGQADLCAPGGSALGVLGMLGWSCGLGLTSGNPQDGGEACGGGRNMPGEGGIPSTSLQT